MIHTKFQYKILLVAGGIIFSLVFVETFMRLGGSLFNASQDLSNKVSLDKREDYRILCLGESMLALGGKDAFPRQLERILNERAPDISFKVINKGVPSTTTTQIAANIPMYLEQYEPHMVVSMMGINDGASFVPIHEEMANPVKRFLNNLRMYKFYKLLKAHVIAKLKELTVRNVKRRLERFSITVEANPSANNYRKMASLDRVLLDWDRERDMLSKTLKLNPQDYEANAYLGMNYRRQGNYTEAIPFLEKAIRYSPAATDIRMQSYAMLVECLILLEQYDRAREVQLKAIDELPAYSRGWGCLADIYILENNCELAKPLYLKQLKINPTDIMSFVKLSFCLKKEGNYDTAEKLLKQARELNPKSSSLQAELGSLLLERKKYREAEEILKGSLSLTAEAFEGTDINIPALLHTCYKAQGKEREAKQIEKIIKIQDQGYNLETYKNYQALQSELAQRNIFLFATQYPMRSVKRLKNMINQNGHVTIVDNEVSFKKALENEPYEAYFIDRFAGDFGHCTVKGNRLIAENIANSILSEIQETHESHSPRLR